jgi:phosphatidate cytidylyltransferase
MAFNWQTFQTRSLSALVFVAVMAVGLLWNEWSFIVLFALVHLGCWVEYFRLTQAIHKDVQPLPFVLLSGLIMLGLGIMLLFAGPLQFWEKPLTHMGFILCIGSGLLLVAGIVMLQKKGGNKLLPAALAGLLYISLSLGLLVKLRTDDTYPEAHYALAIPLLIILNNWINDTMAYIVGSLVGKTPLSPISPKKTWEGTIGGLILSVAAISLIAYLTKLLPVHHAAVLSAIGAISGTYGDLFESKLKRLAGVKDSGNMMPGHGGFLDRFDSLLFSATAGAVYVALAMQ